MKRCYLFIKMTPFYFQYYSGEIVARLRDGEKCLQRGISFGLQKGESLAMVGRSGAGKTITAMSILGLLPENVYQKEEKVVLDGMELDANERRALLGNEIVYIPQNGSEFLNPREAIFDAMIDNMKRIGFAKDEFKKVAIEKLSLVGFAHPEEVLSRYPFELSGGECQRVTVAIAALANPKLLIADEPTNGLDEVNIKIFLDLLKYAFPDTCKIIITHDAKIAKHCDKMLGINKIE